jgi:hypothetical protein
MMNDAVEDTLTVFARSPPVPTMSTESLSPSSPTACAYIARTRPRISSTVSPLPWCATRKAAIVTSGTPPSMIWSMAHAAVSSSMCRPCMSPTSRSGHVRTPLSTAASSTGAEDWVRALGDVFTEAPRE